MTLGRRQFAIYGATDADRIWELAGRATITLLSELLAAHGSAERAFGLYGGNDFFVAFVTPEMARVINAASSPREHLHDGAG